MGERVECRGSGRRCLLRSFFIKKINGRGPVDLLTRQLILSCVRDVHCSTRAAYCLDRQSFPIIVPFSFSCFDFIYLFAGPFSYVGHLLQTSGLDRCGLYSRRESPVVLPCFGQVWPSWPMFFLCVSLVCPVRRRSTGRHGKHARSGSSGALVAALTWSCCGRLRCFRSTVGRQRRGGGAPVSLSFLRLFCLSSVSLL